MDANAISGQVENEFDGISKLSSMVFELMTAHIKTIEAILKNKEAADKDKIAAQRVLLDTYKYLQTQADGDTRVTIPKSFKMGAKN